jgi:hypothetical protein
MVVPQYVIQSAIYSYIQMEWRYGIEIIPKYNIITILILNLGLKEY